MFFIDSQSQVPLYVQLYSQIKDLILSGKLPSDSRLPSVRELAAELCVARNTVETCYLELYAEGYIYSKARSGYFVSALSQDAALVSRSPRESRSGTPPAPAPRRDFDFHPARLDPEAFPLRLWRKCLLESLRRHCRDFTHYGEAQGEARLRAAIRKYLERSRGVLCSEEQIVICSGLQQSLDTVVHLLKERDPVVAVENPGYHLPRSVFRNHALPIVPIPVTSHGIDLGLLRQSASTVAYVTPSHQFPTGCVMPVANRLGLIEWAQSGGKVIIEDDYDSELRYHGKPIPAMQGLNPGADIVYLGTFSKVLSPALRVSYMVLPPSLLDGYRSLFRDHLCAVPLLEQWTLAEFMEQGHWERHLRRMRTLYKRKHDALLLAVGRHFGASATVAGEGAGLHVLLRLPGNGAGEEELLGSAARSGISIFPFSSTCVGMAAEPPTFLLGFGGMTVPEMERGIELLARSWESLGTGGA